MGPAGHTAFGYGVDLAVHLAFLVALILVASRLYPTVAT